MKDPIVLSSDSHTLDGCDRVILDGDQVIVQGKPGNRSDFPSIRVPDDEVLSTVSVIRGDVPPARVVRGLA